MKHLVSSYIFRMFKYFSLVIAVVLFVIVLITHLFVRSWQKTEAGIVPAKTAVVLYAINHNVVSLDINLPDLMTKKGRVHLKREIIDIPARDGTKLPALVFTPKNVLKDEKLPVILYFHGGAFLEGYGSIYSHENIMRALSLRTNSIVIGIGYRVAPTFTFPKAIEDSYNALNYIYEHAEKFQGEKMKIAVAGDSAGGNIAAAVSKMAKDLNGPNIVAQVLYYPITSFLDEDFSSRQKYASGYYLLSRTVMERARDAYTPEPEMWTSPYASLLHADDLENLPPTFIITAEYDPLRDEGELFAEKLYESGVPVEVLRFNGMMHGFVSFYEVMRGSNFALNKSVAYLKNIFHNKIEEKPFEVKVYNVEEEQFYLLDTIEAYIIAMILLAKQARAMIIP